MKWWERKRFEKLLMKYFDGDLSPQEEKLLMEIVESDTEAKEIFNKLTRLDAVLKMSRLKKRTPEVDVGKIARPHFRVRRIKSPWLLISSVAAVMVIVIVSVLMYYKTIEKITAETAATVESQAGYVKKVFRINLPGARRVSVVGDFNGWNPYVTPMKDVSGSGDWYAEVEVPEGAHHYMFLVDGRILVPDASTGVFLPDGYGGTDSILIALER